MIRNTRLVTAVLTSWLALLQPEAAAQTYPARPIRVIVATSPGGLSDIFIRALGDELQKAIGQPLVVENRPGGGFNIATRSCIGTEADGYTICLLPGEAVTYNIFLSKNLGFDPVNELAPITNLFFLTQALMVSASLKANNLTELASLSKAKPATLSYTSAGYSQTLFLERYKQQSGADMVRVPFKGGGDAVTGLLSGTTPVTFVGLGNLISHINAGTAVALLVDSERRSSLVPNAPTISEYGYKGDINRSYFGLFAPAKIPPSITARLRDEIARVAERPEFVSRQLTQRGLVSAISQSPQHFTSFLRDDRASAERVVKESGLQAQ